VIGSPGPISLRGHDTALLCASALRLRTGQLVSRDA
jgi:hypothetical protein